MKELIFTRAEYSHVSATKSAYMHGILRTPVYGPGRAFHVVKVFYIQHI